MVTLLDLLSKLLAVRDHTVDAATRPRSVPTITLRDAPDRDAQSKAPRVLIRKTPSLLFCMHCSSHESRQTMSRLDCTS